MKKTIAMLLLCATWSAGALAADETASAPPQVGQPAPAFKLQDQTGAWRTLEQYRGSWLVLYFYPKDFTSGCTTQACAFRDDVTKLREAGAQVIGVSVDDVKSHAEFAEKYHLPFPLLSDSSKDVARRYGVLASRLGFEYARRDTFLIDPNAVVSKHYENVDPEQNVKQVLADLAALKSAAP
jgi:peroxiredoxin Q/BCP